MQVIVKRPGRYNDATGHARRYVVGEMLETAVEYAHSLLASGYVALPAKAIAAVAGAAVVAEAVTEQPAASEETVEKIVPKHRARRKSKGE